jgi:hypothetical protein
MATITLEGLLASLNRVAVSTIWSLCPIWTTECNSPKN